MLVATLDPNDLNFENLRTFDGTTVYAQNKVCVVLVHCALFLCIYMFCSARCTLLTIQHCEESVT